MYCVLDPDAPDRAVLEASLRLARLLALATLREQQHDVDAAAIGTAMAGIRGQLDAIRALKTQLTSIGTAAGTVSTGLDRLREGVLATVAQVEAELRSARAAECSAA